MLVENSKMIDDEIEIAKLFNGYFVNIVKRLRLFLKEQSDLKNLAICSCSYKNRTLNYFAFLILKVCIFLEK